MSRYEKEYPRTGMADSQERKVVGDRTTAKDNLDEFCRAKDLVYRLWIAGGSRDPRSELPASLAVQADPARLARLRAGGMLTYFNNVWDVSYPVSSLLENLTQEQVVPLESLGGLKAVIETNLGYYLKAKEQGGNVDLYYRKIMRTTRNLMGSISTIMDYIYSEEDTAFRYEPNVEIKRQILEDCLNRLKILRDHIVGTNFSSSSLNLFFKSEFEDSADVRLQEIGSYYRGCVVEVYGHRAMRIYHLLDERLRIVERTSRLRRKINMLTRMHYAGKLDMFSDYDAVMSDFPTRLKTPRGLHLSLSADFDDDENGVLARHLAVSRQSRQQAEAPRPMSAADLAPKDDAWEDAVYKEMGLERDNDPFDATHIALDAERFSHASGDAHASTPLEDILRFFEDKDREYVLSVYLYLVIYDEGFLRALDGEFVTVSAGGRTFDIIRTEYASNR